MMNATAATSSRASGGGGNPAQSRRRVQRAFKMRGLAVQAGALDAMLNVLSREASQSSQEVLTAVLDEIKERLMQSDRGGGKGGGGGRGSGSGGGGGGQQLVVTKSLLADVVADLSRDGGDVTEEALQLLDAFSTPRLSYDSMRKQFTLLTDRMEQRSLHGEAIHKVRAMFLACVVMLSTLCATSPGTSKFNSSWAKQRSNARQLPCAHRPLDGDCHS